MKIGEIIREKRKVQSLTQEQLANLLGVSATAVHKWEKGATYPDITTLPALARVLKTDLNTLLSFREDLTDEEITRFVGELKKMIESQSYDAAFQRAMEEIHQYPNCEKLIYSVVFYLDGARAVYDAPNPDNYTDRLMPFYERLSRSETPVVRDAALTMCIAYYRNRKEFDRATALIEELPDIGIDKEEQLAVLYAQQENYQEARKLWESRILRCTAYLQTALISLMDIAIREGQEQDARFLTQTSERVLEQLSVNRWIPYVPKLELATRLQDRAGCLEALQKILPAMGRPPKDSPLFRSVSGRNPESVAAIVRQLRSKILNNLEHDEEFAFFRGSPEYEQLRPLLEHPDQ